MTFSLRKMDSSVRRRRTWEDPSDFSDLPADVSHQAAVYVRLCDSNELRMRQLVDDLQDISEKLQRLQSRSELCRVAGVLLAAVGLGAVVAAFISQLTGGLSLAVTAAAGYAAAAGTVLSFRAKQEATEGRRVKKIKEFLEVVALLQNQLEVITKLCEDNQRESGVGRLSDVLQPLLGSSRTSSSELSEQCENVFNQFRSVRRTVEELRGREGAENIQTETE